VTDECSRQHANFQYVEFIAYGKQALFGIRQLSVEMALTRNRGLLAFSICIFMHVRAANERFDLLRSPE
jgi:hypothetical protein